MDEERFKYISFLVALLIVFITFFLMGGVYFHVFNLHIYFGQFYYHHWFVWIGTLYIAFATPIYYLLKRQFPNRFKMYLNIHVFGNLLAFLLVSIHFTQQISRPPQAYPSLGTGIALYIAMIVLVCTGFLLRFIKPKKLGIRSVRFIHTGVTLSFYLIIVVHILHGLNII